MGQPRVTEESIRELQDTSDWAFDPVTGDHYYNWANVTEMEYGFGHYNNPDMYYQVATPLLCPPFLRYILNFTRIRI